MDGSGSKSLLFKTGDHLYPASWTHDGRTLVAMRLVGPPGTFGLWTIDPADAKAFRYIVPSGLGGRLSPDDRWLAFFANVAGRQELFVTAFPRGGARWRISSDGAREAVWSRDGKELFFRSGAQVLVAAVKPGPTFAWASPRLLFEGNYVQGGGGPGNVFYDVSLDAKRFLMLEEPSVGPLRFNVIQGWDRIAVQTQESSTPRNRLARTGRDSRNDKIARKFLSTRTMTRTFR